MGLIRDVKAEGLKHSGDNKDPVIETDVLSVDKNTSNVTY